MAKSLITVTSFLLFSMAAFSQEAFEKLIPVNAESGNAIIEKLVKTFQIKLSQIKSNSDLRIFNNMLILELNRDLGCDFRKVVLYPTLQIKGEKSRELLQVTICSEPIGALILDRTGSQIKPMSYEELLNGQFPLPSNEKHWNLKNNWGNTEIQVSKYDDHQVTKLISSGCNLIIEESLSKVRLLRRYQLVCEPALPEGAFKFEIEVQIHPNEFFPSIEYRTGHKSIDTANFNILYTQFTSFIGNFMTNLFEFPRFSQF